MEDVHSEMPDKKKQMEKAGQQNMNQGQHESEHLPVDKVILIKMCRKHPKRRVFQLFNDTLVYGKPAGESKIISQHTIPLEDIKIEDITNDSPMTELPKNLRNGWVIYTSFKSFAVYSDSEEEKTKWMTLLNTRIEQQRQRKGITKDAASYAAVWIPDFEVRKCMVCDKSQFNIVKRRHHCRKCGRVVCSSCSQQKVILPKQSSKPLRVCKECYEYLDKISNKSTPSNSVTSKDLDIREPDPLEWAQEVLEEPPHQHSHQSSPTSSQLSMTSLEVKRINEG